MSRRRPGQAMSEANLAYNANKARAALVKKLRAERVQGDEHTPAELIAIRDQLKADFYARNPEVAS